jgi:hypothetical protein
MTKPRKHKVVLRVSASFIRGEARMSNVLLQCGEISRFYAANRRRFNSCGTAQMNLGAKLFAEEGTTRRQRVRHSSFGLTSSFVIRHSSFSS